MNYCYTYKGLVGNNYVYQDVLGHGTDILIQPSDSQPVLQTYLDLEFTTQFKAILNG